jgi:hypothetical protein
MCDRQRDDQEKQGRFQPQGEAGEASRSWHPSQYPLNNQAVPPSTNYSALSIANRNMLLLPHRAQRMSKTVGFATFSNFLPIHVVLPNWRQ